jgi:hypothetical protein
LDGGGKLEIGATDGNGKVYVDGEARREMAQWSAQRAARGGTAIAPG